jgi:hypothetical protein
MNVEIGQRIQKTFSIAPADPAAAKAHQNAVTDLVGPEARRKGLQRIRYGLKDPVGIFGSFIRKAPGRGEERVDDEIGHLGPAVVDVVTDAPAFRVGLDALLDFENSGSCGLGPLAAWLNVV